jgi:integrase
VRLHTIPEVGSVAMTKLTAQHIQLLYAKKLEEGLSTTSVNHLHAALHRAFDAALRLGIVQRNVFDLVEVPRMRHLEMTTLSEEQAQTLLATARGERLEALYVLALATGMREGELLALKWQDVDLDGATLQVRATVHIPKKGTSSPSPRPSTAGAGLRCRGWRWTHSTRLDSSKRSSARTWEKRGTSATWSSPIR